MGGIGKATHTQLVYNDERVAKHFELRIWVCVSKKDFSLQRLVKEILEDVLGHVSHLNELNPLMLLLQDKLRGKKFLLVLDDVWNEKQSLWDPLKEAFRSCRTEDEYLVAIDEELVKKYCGGVLLAIKSLGGLM
ncbi:putative disease resistance protein RGA3 [Henckelia pumila]|uniref:putative disease resistance protein RGA3 n=1 Tax=Henckelia pumila TaxID=405737 RepID=UPI003C6E37C8